MASSTIQVTIGVKWRVPVYVRTLVFFCLITGLEPDERKVKRVLDKGVCVVQKVRRTARKSG